MIASDVEWFLKLAKVLREGMLSSVFKLTVLVALGARRMNLKTSFSAIDGLSDSDSLMNGKSRARLLTSEHLARTTHIPRR